MREKLLEVLADARPGVEFEGKTGLIDEGYLDSFDIITLVTELNEKFDIDIPVVYVTGIVSEINCLRESIELQRSFQKQGYKVGMISNSKEVESQKDSFYCYFEEYNVENIVKINHFVKQIENTNHYDLLFVVLMSGAGILGRKVIEDFGLEVYSWRRAVPFDCIVLNVFYGNYTEESLAILGNSVQDVLGSKVDFYNIVDQMLDLDESEKNNSVHTWPVDRESLQNSIFLLKSNVNFLLQNILLMICSV